MTVPWQICSYNDTKHWQGNCAQEKSEKSNCNALSNKILYRRCFRCGNQLTILNTQLQIWALVNKWKIWSRVLVTDIPVLSAYFITSALAQRAMQTAGIARGGMSVCLSVTLRYCIKTKKASVMNSSLSESLNIIVSRNIWFITKFDLIGVSPSEGDFWDCGGYELAISQPINRRISETVKIGPR